MPHAWLNTCAMVTDALPPAANSGQCKLTGSLNCGVSHVNAHMKGLGGVGGHVQESPVDTHGHTDCSNGFGVAEHDLRTRDFGAWRRIELCTCSVFSSYSRAPEALLKLPPAKLSTQRPRWNTHTAAPTSSLRVGELVGWV
jgi:hypothetical protein